MPAPPPPAVEELRGEKATYRIGDELGRGRAGVTYLATVLQLLKQDTDLVVGQTVVIKLPNIDTNLPFHEQMRLYARVAELTGAEYSSLQKLKDLECVATVLDWGAELITLASNVQMPAIFLVQKHVTGAILTNHFASAYQGNVVESPDEFFKWAMKLARGMLLIHQRRVIHGDIWPDNIIVRESAAEVDPVFIDFGQAIFRDLVFDPTQAEGRNSSYIAPEKSKSVGGDVYSLGGVLYFLATGQHPFDPIEDIDALKSAVVKNMKSVNPRLYRENCGLADIIARCLRYSRHGRTPHAHALIEDIETFQRGRANSPSYTPSHSDLQKAFAHVEEQGNPFFVWVADLRAQTLITDLEDMAHDMYDLTGGHETLVSALTQFVSILGRGDSYLTMSTAAYWLPKNVGINGRFLSMNKLAAMNGTTIRRIFVVTDAELESDQDLRKALTFHLDEMDELRQAGVRTDRSDIEAGGYYACVEKVAADLQASMVRQGMHFGLANKGTSQMVLYPIYREDRTLVSIQFRVGEGFSHLDQEFRKHLANSDPLERYRETLRRTGAD